MGQVEAVLFDSGGVLIGPVGGRWNPRFDFEEVVRRRAPALSAEDIGTAIAAGDAFLRTAHPTSSRDDYHRVMLDELRVDATADLLADLDRPLDPVLVIEPYEEVVEVLDSLRARGVRMAVVSDAWPELPDLHAGVGIRDYFEAYAISAVLGCAKPDRRMFHHASDALGVRPERCLFVDDTPDLVEAAIALGYQGCAVRRDGSLVDGLPTVADLRGLLPMID